MTTAIAPAKPNRALWLDRARGLAVIAMVVYHFMWDLSHFGVIAADVGFDPQWKLFAKAIAASFLLIAGIGLAFATRDGLRWPAFLKRLAVIGAAALAVTVVTRFTFPDRYIFFGILHCIAVSSLIALAFRPLPVAVIAACGIIMLLTPGWVRLDGFNAPGLVWLGLGTVVPASNDFEPVFPWSGWLLIGLALGKSGLLPMTAGGSDRRRWLVWLGRWSLVIYLLHQPILFSLVGEAAGRGWLPLAGREARFLEGCAGDCMVGGASAATCRATCACTVETLKARGQWTAALTRSTSLSDVSAAAQACLRRGENLTPPAANA